MSMVQLDGNINQSDQIDIYRILYSTMAQHNLLSSSSETFTKIKHTNKLKRIISYKACSQTTVELNKKSITKN